MAISSTDCEPRTGLQGPRRALLASDATSLGEFSPLLDALWSLLPSGRALPPAA